jgi:hypothetical protein
VAAEGARGITKRARAWLRRSGLDKVPSAFFVLEAPQLRVGQDVEAFLKRLSEAGASPNLIVFDTLASCIVGGDENSAKDIGEAVAACREIQAATGAAVLLVHHTGKQKQDIERGSSALRGAADTMLLQNRNGELIRVRNNKQKEDEESNDISLRLECFPADVDGDVQITSCVLVSESDPDIATRLSATTFSAGG